MKTFPLVDYHVIKEIHEKCTHIVSGLKSMIPEDANLEDMIRTTHTEDPNVEESITLYEPLFYRLNNNISIKKYDESSDSVIFQSRNVISGNYEKLSVDALILRYTDVRKVKFKAYLIWPHLLDSPYHRSIYLTAINILGALKADKPINTLNLELSAALEFLNGLEEEDWKQGLVTPCTIELDRIKKEKVAYDSQEFKKRKDSEYEEGVAEFRESLKKYSLPTKNKPTKELTEEPRKLSLWQKIIG